MTEEELQGLLRLKRYEKPPAGYEERFLREFRRRQRADILKQPLATIIWDRFAAALPEFRVPAYAYGVIGLFAVSVSAWILTTEELADPLPGQSITQTTAAPAVSFDLHSDAPKAVPSRPVTIPASRRVSGTKPSHYELPRSPSAQTSEPYRF